MRVSAISNTFANQNINFESKKQKNTQISAQHVSNPLKAVPVAVLLAMSPINAPAYATDNGIKNEIEVLQTDSQTTDTKPKKSTPIPRFIIEANKYNFPTRADGIFDAKSSEVLTHLDKTSSKLVSKVIPNAQIIKKVPLEHFLDKETFVGNFYVVKSQDNKTNLLYVFQNAGVLSSDTEAKGVLKFRSGVMVIDNYTIDGAGQNEDNVYGELYVFDQDYYASKKEMTNLEMTQYFNRHDKTFYNDKKDAFRNILTEYRIDNIKENILPKYYFPINKDGNFDTKSTQVKQFMSENSKNILTHFLKGEAEIIDRIPVRRDDWGHYTDIYVVKTKANNQKFLVFVGQELRTYDEYFDDPKNCTFMTNVSVIGIYYKERQEGYFGQYTDFEGQNIRIRQHYDYETKQVSEPKIRSYEEGPEGLPLKERQTIDKLIEEGRITGINIE